jgi:hypothetical protein
LVIYPFFKADRQQDNTSHRIAQGKQACSIPLTIHMNESTPDMSIKSLLTGSEDNAGAICGPDTLARAAALGSARGDNP